MATLSERRDWVSTFSGEPFFPLDPRPEDVRIIDIAHALSNLCRFAGHTKAFYSVAQHCCLVSEICGEGLDGLWGLLHDASEAYLSDIMRPVKHADELEGYRLLEVNVQAAICVRFGLGAIEPAIVRSIDRLVCRAEQRDLCNMPTGWTSRETAYPSRIVPQTPALAKRLFLERFTWLATPLGIE